MTNFFTQTVTVYISVPVTDIKPRAFERRVVKNCTVQGQTVEKIDGTMRRVVNATTLITKNIANYVDAQVFYDTPADLRKDIYTIQTGDFIVFEECDDVVNDANEFAELQRKHRNNGMVATTVSAYINGMKTDNVTVTNA